MNLTLIISLILLLQVILDATGDALRFRGKQILHHCAEAIQIALWLTIWALFPFHWEYIVLYTLGRIALFDPTFILVARLKITHIGNSSIYDRILISVFSGILKWFSLKVKEPGHLVWVLRVLALASWVGLLLRWGYNL